MDSDDDLLTIAQACELLSCSRSTLWRLNLPVVKIGTMVRYRRADVLNPPTKEDEDRAFNERWLHWCKYSAPTHADDDSGFYEAERLRAQRMGTRRPPRKPKSANNPK